MSYIKIAAETELPAEGQVKEFEAAGKTICVARVNGTCSAMENNCIHMGGPLGQGYVENGKVVCPWHGWEYDAATGALEGDPKTRIDVYPLRIENGDVLVDV
jgi:nitrite reductase (NADH) small subunit